LIYYSEDQFAGPLSLLKSDWLQETDLSSAKQNVVEFILNTRERLRHALDNAKQHATDERTKSKQWYDRKAVLQSFEPGDKILVLLPMPGKPLKAKFHGPDFVEERLGPVDYVISTPDRRKSKRVCHVNLLKRYYDREEKLNQSINFDLITLEHSPAETVNDDISVVR